VNTHAIVPEIENTSINEAALVQLAGRISSWRRKRDAVFIASTFADPEWDILLDLFAQNGLGRQVSMSSLCIAASVPTSTAVRCISTMIARGALVRFPDPKDARRVLIELSAESRARMRFWLSGVLQTQTCR